MSSKRRASTSSSLELGYSHTAQNSALSDTSASLELDYSVQSAHTSSGVYTLRSSTAAHTLACSSQTSGIVLDQSEGMHKFIFSFIYQWLYKIAHNVLSWPPLKGLVCHLADSVSTAGEIASTFSLVSCNLEVTWYNKASSLIFQGRGN